METAQTDAVLPARDDYDALLLFVAVSTALNEPGVPIDMGTQLLDLLMPGMAGGRISSYARHGWMLRDDAQENFLVYDANLPRTGNGLRGAGISELPDEAAENVASHWTHGVRQLRPEHLCSPYAPPDECRDGRIRAMRRHDSPVVETILATGAASAAPTTPPELVPAPHEDSDMDETDSADADVADPTDADTATDPPADANAPMVVQRRVAQFLHEAYGFAQTTEDGTFTAEQIEPTLAAVGIVNSVGPLISSVKRMGFLEIAGRTEGPRPVFIYRPVYGIAYQDKRTKAVVTVERPGPATVPDGDGDADPVASIPAFRSKEELVEELGTEQARLTTYRAEYVRAETARRERESLEREIAETELLLAAKRQRSTELFDIPFPTDDEPAIVAHVRDLEAVIERYGPTLRILLRQT